MNFLVEALVFLGAALVVVPICKRLGLSSVLGYLAAGVLIGPAVLSLVGDPDETLHFAEIGVVLLLFIIGLELNPRRLWVMRRLVFGLGSMQVALTTLLIAACLFLVNVPAASALLLGFALALSSTAFVLQLLSEQQKLTTPHGRAAFGVLLLQDVAVIPAIVVLSLLLTSSGGEQEGIELWKLAAVAAGIVAARFLLRPLLRFIASTNIQELFTAASLALVVGAALAMSAAGLSMGLGAFIAGMIVADSEYRHQLETDVNPFKGLLLGLFFIAVGMMVDLQLLVAETWLIAGLTLALLALKAVVLFPLCRWQGLDRKEAMRGALVLAQGGEFAFVLLTAGSNAGLVETGTRDLAALVVTLSMALTPLLTALGERLLGSGGRTQRPFDDISADHENQVVIAGFGRVGQIVARVLTMHHIPFTALDANPEHVDFVRKFGNETYFGDARRLDVLRAAGVARARALVVALDDEKASEQIVRGVKSTFPRVKVFARARTRHHEIVLRQAGVDFVLRDTLLSSLGIATELLTDLGFARHEAEAIVERFREHDARTLERQSEVLADDEAFRKAAMDAAVELRQLFAADTTAEKRVDPG
jgi:glutathione-regulated potassium-efflux system ancillary protein KefC/glutathione-regulated potassium-efflux system protein KefB